MILLYLPSNYSEGQNIFPNKTKDCDNDLPIFFLDGGTEKASIKQESDKLGLDSIYQRCNLAKRVIHKFQILVDTNGNGVVLSHTLKDNEQPLCPIAYLNSFKWTVAKDGDTKINSSVNYVLRINRDGITGNVQKYTVDFSNMYSIGEPQNNNKHYTYLNKRQHKYDFVTFTKQNSYLPHNMSQKSALDKSGRLWYSTYEGLVMIEGGRITAIDSINSPFHNDAHIYDIAVDRNNTVWFVYQNKLYNYTGSEWKVYDSTFTKMSRITGIFSSYSKDIIICGSNKIMTINHGELGVLNETLNSRSTRST